MTDPASASATDGAARLDAVVPAAVPRPRGAAGGAAGVGDRARRAAAVAARDRHRLRARRQGRSRRRSQPWMPAIARRQPLRAARRRRRRRRACCRSCNQLVSAYGTQVQVDTGQRMVYDLRGTAVRASAPALGLHHHITTSTADAVYRVDVDAYAIENLVMSGLFPLATSIIALAVMFGVLLQHERDDRAAVADGRAVPVPLPALLHVDAGQPRRARQGARVEAARRGSTRRSARCGWSRASRASRTSCERYAAAGETTMNARIAHHLAAVAVLGRRQHDHHPRHRAGRDRRRRLRDERPADDRRADGGHQPISARSTARCRRSRTPPASCRARSPAPSGCARCSR